MREIFLTAGVVFLCLLLASGAIVSWRAATDVHDRCEVCGEQMSRNGIDGKYLCTSRSCFRGFGEKKDEQSK